MMWMPWLCCSGDPAGEDVVERIGERCEPTARRDVTSEAPENSDLAMGTLDSMGFDAGVVLCVLMSRKEPKGDDLWNEDAGTDAADGNLKASSGDGDGVEPRATLVQAAAIGGADDGVGAAARLMPAAMFGWIEGSMN